MRGREDTIVVRELPEQIERYPHLLSFTGWYAVARNGLCSSDLVAILEYDVTLAPAFGEMTVEALSTGHCIVGYIQYPLTSPMYLHGTPWLIDSLQSVYGLDLPELIRDGLAGGRPDRWNATSNHAMRTADLQAFVEWYVPLTETFRHDPTGGAVHERAVAAFCLLNDIEDRYVADVLEHEQAESHGVPARSQDETRRLAEETVRLVPDEELYPRLLLSEQRLAEEGAKLAGERAKRLAMEEAHAAQRGRAEALERSVARLHDALAAQTTRARALKARNESVLASTSWRLTAPLRWLGAKARSATGRRG